MVRLVSRPDEPTATVAAPSAAEAHPGKQTLVERTSSRPEREIPRLQLAVGIAHRTARPGGDGNHERTIVGVGERVQLTAAGSGTWRATTTGGDQPRTHVGPDYAWTAPATPGPVTIERQAADGAADAVTFNVVAPTSLDFVAPTAGPPSGDGAGASMTTHVRAEPHAVDFSAVRWRELGGAATSATGYFAGRPLPHHDPTGQWLPLTARTADDAAFWGFPAPWGEGSFEWSIRNQCEVDGEVAELPATTQRAVLTRDGTLTLSKGSASVTQRPRSSSASGAAGSRGATDTAAIALTDGAAPHGGSGPGDAAPHHAAADPSDANAVGIEGAPAGAQVDLLATTGAAGPPGGRGRGFLTGAGVQLNVESDRGVTADVRRNNVGGRMRVGGPVGPVGVYVDAAARWTFGAGIRDGGPIIRGNLLQLTGGVGVYWPPVPFTGTIPAALRVPHVYFGAQLAMGAHFEARRGPGGLSFELAEVPLDGTLVLGLRVPSIDFDFCWTIGRMNLLTFGGMRWIDGEYRGDSSYVRLGSGVEALIQEGREVVERVQREASRFANMIRAFTGGRGAARRELDAVPRTRHHEPGSSDLDVQIKFFDAQRGAVTADPHDRDYASPDSIISVQRSMRDRFPFGTRVTLSRGNTHIPLTVHEIHSDPTAVFNVSRANFDRLGAAAEPHFSAAAGVSPRDVRARVG